MTFDTIIIRYGEISLKGKNRIDFEKNLKKNIQNLLKLENIEFSEIQMKRGRLYIRGIQTLPPLQRVLGIHSFSPAKEIERNYQTIKNQIQNFIPTIAQAKSFRVSCQRIDKRFPHRSIDMEKEIGEIIFTATETPVNLTNPAFHLFIEIGESQAYLYTEKIMAFRGLPVGSAGKLISLVSSGIDSPVATFLMMKRGVIPILLHFKISDQDAAYVERLKEKLQLYAAHIPLKLIIIDRNELFQGRFEEIYQSRFHSYTCILCKYLMHKKAGEICTAENASGIITGDNLAQVASQTLKNMRAYWQASQYPIYSPLISFEKMDTIALAKQIGTYDLSIQSVYGCTPPKNPKTNVDLLLFKKVLHETGLE
jgi:thiamine biosynthesis protein ThiI